jgi:uncharacterized protein (TIGR03000 family)
MYSIVLLAFLTTGNEVPEFGRHRHGCCGGGVYYSTGCSGCWGGGCYSYGCCGGCYGGGCGGCYGGGCGGCYGGGCGGASAGGAAAAGGGGTPTGSAGGGSASRGGDASTEVTQSIQELKKSIAELKDEQSKFRLEGLKRTVDDLRVKELEQKINELRRSIEELKLRVVPGTVPGPRTAPELPAPRSGKVLLQVPSDALVFVNDKLISTAPTFTTPPLEPGKASFYDFEVTVVRDGKNIARTKRVSIRAGEVVRLAYADMKSSDTNWTKDKTAAAPAHITVRLPADARLTVDGVDCPLTSATRTFETPELAPGQEYFYILKIKVLRDGRQIEQTRRVAFRSGERVAVSFENLVAANIAAR